MCDEASLMIYYDLHLWPWRRPQKSDVVSAWLEIEMWPFLAVPSQSWCNWASDPVLSQYYNFKRAGINVRGGNVIALALALAAWTKTLTLALNQKRSGFHIAHMYPLWHDLLHGTMIFTLKFDLQCTFETFSLCHYFQTRCRVFILSICIPCDKTFHVVPTSWPFFYVWKTLTLVTTFKPESVKLLYWKYAFLVARPFTWYHTFSSLPKPWSLT